MPTSNSALAGLTVRQTHLGRSARRLLTLLPNATASHRKQGDTMAGTRKQPISPKRSLGRHLPAAAAVITLLVIWQVWASFAAHSPAAADNPSTRPVSPGEIVTAAIRTWPTLWPATKATAYEGFAGFAIAAVLGVALGVAFHCSRLLDAAFSPLLAAAQTLPLIAIAPLFLIWFGFEPEGKVAIVTLFALFPITVQTMRGLDAVPTFYSDVALTCGATRVWTLWHVKLRVAARQVCAGLRISAAYVFATAATAEYLGARGGLGIWLQAAYNSFNTRLVFVATLDIIVMTVLLLAAVSLAERLLLGDPRDDDNPDE